jgi:hypothetical protein
MTGARASPRPGAELRPSRRTSWSFHHQNRGEARAVPTGWSAHHQSLGQELETGFPVSTKPSWLRSSGRLEACVDDRAVIIELDPDVGGGDVLYVQCKRALLRLPTGRLGYEPILKVIALLDFSADAGATIFHDFEHQVDLVVSVHGYRPGYQATSRDDAAFNQEVVHVCYYRCLLRVCCVWTIVRRVPCLR